MITVPWSDEFLDRPILRTSSDALSGAELQGGATAKRLKSLGEKMGYPETVTWYWLRRLVLNAVDGLCALFCQSSRIPLTPGAGFGSEEVRNQVAGHLDSRTYRNNYQDQRITLDVASLVRGQETEDALIRKLNDIGTNADPDANVALSPEALEHIASLPDVASLRSEHHRLAEALKDKYGSITEAPASEELLDEYMRAKTAHRTRKEFHKALKGFEKAWGPDHTSTLDTVNNLGNLYSDLGRMAEAEEMYLRALKRYDSMPPRMQRRVDALGRSLSLSKENAGLGSSPTRVVSLY